MAANTDPIYSKLSDIQGSALINTAATTVYDASGTIGTDIYKIFTADATNGGFVQRIRFKYAANGTTASNACVIKIWLTSAGSGTLTIGTNAWFIDEIALPATGTLTTTAPNNTYDLPLNFAIPAGYFLCAKITVSQGANTGWMATTIAGKY